MGNKGVNKMSEYAHIISNGKKGINKSAFFLFLFFSYNASPHSTKFFSCTADHTTFILEFAGKKGRGEKNAGPLKIDSGEASRSSPRILACRLGWYSYVV